jgi:DNA adenine methylase
MWSRSRSLLRYPGSKARFSKFISKTLFINNLDGSLFVEPFCGGASVAIALLEEGVVDKIALNDADLSISSLWSIVFNPQVAPWLAEQVLTIPLTMNEWDHQKQLVPESTRQAALRCLYLNRTSFNGIIQARSGPIGGRSQKNRTLGVRFNREALANRILELSKLSDRVISVSSEPWKYTLSRFRRRRNVVFYLDPPFYHKAERLYSCWFNTLEHIKLRDSLQRLKKPWLLSYDYASEVRQLYDPLDLRSRVIDSTYSAHPIGGCSIVGRELFFTNLQTLPASDPLHIKHKGLTIINHDDESNVVSGFGPVRRPCNLATI